MKDSVKIIVDISACIDELEIPGSLFLVWDNYEKLLSKHTTDAKGHVELNLPPGGSYAFESRAYLTPIDLLQLQQAAMSQGYIM